LSNPTPKYKPHSILFIGGLGDGLLTVPFVPPLAEALAPTQWSLFSLLLSSSYSGWGMRSLDDDTTDIAKAIKYIRKLKRKTRPAGVEGEHEGKIVLMGHSTGSQGVLHYLVYDLRISEPVDAAILQAPISDREGMTIELDISDDSLRLLHKQALHRAQSSWEFQDDDKKAIMPLDMTRPFYGDVVMTAQRWLSLQAEQYEYPVFVDDLFSSDVPYRQLTETFGDISKKVHLCVLYSGKDEHVPHWVDKEDLLEVWQRATGLGEALWDAENSGLVDGATHALHGKEQEEQRKELVRRVVGFLGKVEKE
jgi:hypothetical protein